MPKACSVTRSATESRVKRLCGRPARRVVCRRGADGNYSLGSAVAEQASRHLSRGGGTIARSMSEKEISERSWLVQSVGIYSGFSRVGGGWDAHVGAGVAETAYVRDCAVAAGGSISVLAINDIFVMVDQTRICTVLQHAALDDKWYRRGRHIQRRLSFCGDTVKGHVYRKLSTEAPISGRVSTAKRFAVQ